MGLCLSVGLMADLKENDAEGYANFKATMVQINKALSAESLPPHWEPETMQPGNSISFDMYGYSGLHYLRRIAAHLTYSGTVPPPGNKDAAEDTLLKQYYDESCKEGPAKGFLTLFKRSPKATTFDFNHLIQHSDCEGVYLPIDFVNVVFPDSKLQIPGEMIGSSHQLLNECSRLAESLAIPRDIAAESDELWEAADSQGTGPAWKSYGIESFTCVRLMQACQASIRSGAALVFA